MWVSGFAEGAEQSSGQESFCTNVVVPGQTDELVDVIDYTTNKH